MTKYICNIDTHTFNCDYWSKYNLVNEPLLLDSCGLFVFSIYTETEMSTIMNSFKLNYPRGYLNIRKIKEN